MGFSDDGNKGFMRKMVDPGGLAVIDKSGAKVPGISKGKIGKPSEVLKANAEAPVTLAKKAKDDALNKKPTTLVKEIT